MPASLALPVRFPLPDRSLELGEARVRVEAVAVLLAHALSGGDVYPLDDELGLHVLDLVDQAGRWLERAA